MACVMRRIWFRRNYWVFENIFREPRCVMRTAVEGYKEYIAAQEQRGCMFRQTVSCNREERWTKPVGQWVKVNWDAAVRIDLNKVGIGVVVRDEEREVLASLCKVVDCLHDPSVGEALALKRAVQFCDELGFSNVVLEGDAQVIVKAANNREELYTAYGNVMEEVRGFLKMRESWKIQFIHREANNVAHILAKNAFNYTTERVWIEEGPIEILHVLQKEKFCNS
ncbi:uncharacterized protein LOC122298728 [Carya illinoinensis]|uniref:uncharacterized protein LOC122298728 n=1 Tax=Carya illinoinensis TaxID=32201 RepID=UPI001C71A21E|nr:uncharacterized protein LOC122298728 [Carya illinoinensis]